MFAGSNNTPEESTNSSNIISKDTVIEGNIITSGNLRIEGKVLGNITTKSKAVLGDLSKIEGKIIAQNAEIAGNLDGTIEVYELLTLKPTAIVKGDIITEKLVFEKGAQFNGKCTMLEDIKKMKGIKSEDGKKIK